MKAWEATVRKTQAVAKKRAHSIFGSISVPHEDEDEEETEKIANVTDGSIVEKVLPNGDYYTGQWSNNYPNGQGKYLWTDGCMYVGEWLRGKTNGRGVFSWSTGATYEGEFKSGYIDGKGTYSGGNGNTYRGQWIMNLKHGNGMKNYSNEDWYDGEWRRGLQEGHGKYYWKNGNSYDGEWKNGTMCGKGSFVWANGKRYEGYWEEGMPKGSGTFRWPNGNFYMGNWSKDGNEQNGTYYPSGSLQDANFEWDPQEVYNVDLANCEVSSEEKVEFWPSQKKLSVWNSSKGENSHKPRRMSVDGRVGGGMNIWESDSDDGSCDAGDGFARNRRDLDGALLGLNLEESSCRRPSRPPIRVPRGVKKQGETISKGHRNYDLMLNLQLGIRHSVGRSANDPPPSLDLKASAFDPKEKVWTKFPTEGSKHTPPHQSCEFKWKDYCPLVFRTLRRLFKVDPADYMLSICGNDALRELSSPGKSGSFFYLTNDDRYMIKTMKKSEVKVLIRMLSAYYSHFRTYENTMVIKFYGLHCVKLTGPIQKKVRFIIMGNLFCSEYVIHRRFDLKGSSIGRVTDKPDSECDATTILKDLDLNYIFRLPKSWFQEFCRQVDRDCEFLEQERIMDYSLLVGLHFKQTTSTGDLVPSGSRTPPVVPRTGTRNRQGGMKLGINMPARVERTVRTNNEELVGEPTGEFYDVVIFFGIIDILQDYDISKKLEHAYKSIQYDATSISAVDPKQYSRRFRDFVLKIFGEDT